MFSQRDEEYHILSYFNGHIGTFLDIGAYHPEIFSNTRTLVNNKWKGVYVEPAEDLMKSFEDEYRSNDDIQLIKTAVGTYTGEATFNDSNGDAIGTLDKEHADKWEKGYNVKYKEVVVPVVTVSDLLEMCNYRTFDFISIDIEGLDLDVFRQFNFDVTGTQCVCVEFNGSKKQEYIDHASSYNMILIHETAENLIFAR